MALSDRDHLRVIYRRLKAVEDKIDIIDTNVDDVEGYTEKIDDAAVDGLLGVNNSLAYKVHEIEKHFHGLERWYGADGDNTGSIANNHTSWQLTADGSDNTYGTEVLMLAANDVKAADFDVTPVKFDLHEIEVTAVDTVDKIYYIQIWSGTGIFGAATLRVEFPVDKESVKSEPVPVTVMCPRIAVAENVWGRCKCADGGAKIDILLGIHAYAG